MKKKKVTVQAYEAIDTGSFKVPEYLECEKDQYGISSVSFLKIF